MSSPKRTHVNVAVIGHVDSGKSTLTGHLLYKSGGVSERELETVTKEANDLGKLSFKYAFLLDDLQVERTRGITVDVGLVKIELDKYDFTFIDCPGHRNFIKNMIKGTSQADIAILVVPASPNEYEAAFAKIGQLREHALLAYTLGIKQLIVCVNKMDHKDVNYSQTRFNEIVDEVSEFLDKIGFESKSVPFLPISAWYGDNLTTHSENMSWYTGPTLIEVLNSIQPPVRLTNLPLRIPLQDVYKIGGVGTVPVGRIETGELKVGMNITVCPANVNGEVSSIEMHREVLEHAEAGDNVGFCVKGIAKQDIGSGMVVGDSANDPPRPVVSFEAQVMILDHPNRILPGYTPVIDCHTVHISCAFEKIYSIVNKRTRDVLQENPKFIKTGQAAICELVPRKPICVEPFSKYPPLGRFAVRDMKRTVAVGVILSTKRLMENGDIMICGGPKDGEIIKASDFKKANEENSTSESES